jgi:hypothetical protein
MQEELETFPVFQKMASMPASLAFSAFADSIFHNYF